VKVFSEELSAEGNPSFATVLEERQVVARGNWPTNGWPNCEIGPGLYKGADVFEVRTREALDLEARSPQVGRDPIGDACAPSSPAPAVQGLG